MSSSERARRDCVSEHTLSPPTTTQGDHEPRDHYETWFNERGQPIASVRTNLLSDEVVSTSTTEYRGGLKRQRIARDGTGAVTRVDIFTHRGNQLVKWVIRSPDSDDTVITYVHDAAGNILRTRTFAANSLRESRGTYDDRNRLISQRFRAAGTDWTEEKLGHEDLPDGGWMTRSDRGYTQRFDDRGRLMNAEGAVNLGSTDWSTTTIQWGEAEHEQLSVRQLSFVNDEVAWETTEETTWEEGRPRHQRAAVQASDEDASLTVSESVWLWDCP